MNRRATVMIAGIFLGASPEVFAQDSQAPPQESPKTWEDNHLVGLLPAYNVTRASEVLPLTNREKFRLFWITTKDPVALAAPSVQAAIEQAKNAEAGFGQGTKAYFERYGAAWADATTGRLFRTAVYPTLFHEDPRYFRLGGSAGSKNRVGYALSRVFITRTDSQRTSFNWAKLASSFSAAALCNVYYPAQNRGAGLTLTNVAISYGTEAGMNVLREFWTDLRQRGARKQERK